MTETSSGETSRGETSRGETSRGEALVGEAREARFLEALAGRRLMAIVRGRDAGAALRTVLTLTEEGVDLVEVSLVTKDAPAVIREARAALGDAAGLGAGTVLTAHDAAVAAEAGASYLVTPAVTEAVAEGGRLGLPVLAGAFTPTEVVAALGAGAAAIKLFPAFLGGEAYLRALREPFPGVAFVPVGGVNAAAAAGYLKAGAVAVGAGSPLVGDAADGGDLDSLRERARAFREAL
ncbi:bifunctional 4-hydroxy-2-oxoglutarate aldolase/2-dehydro-3-deoxy-phosphogluconate aldolase [Microbispora sp. RL4-1S]|uniref:Bifunctional 4-hydroxy-2-oxoglutarate aldolase/2-dehydro-3-deoxy-phosphogluconate aldolase n=1 Tax=Microbispora oryzae TaxID=2806554 RepID=A0A940WMU5_9ACTN|nr:bifunctional 4-hydroxy-2-oxoglutarate aldolase/2-dehydro-3-deoxy-phosphogluconate aldolase [Microbispora oryzae]MBP2705918.1 bifunctional 4-hydroxy-2-oxoglutarate aldolase/2-dehydro-3-deoxy-phosphogluconate aldolase [Microbispora oryzae]